MEELLLDDIILESCNGETLASSREIAEKFDKRNPDVNRMIENLIVQNCTVKNMIRKTTYISNREAAEIFGKNHKDMLRSIVI